MGSEPGQPSNLNAVTDAQDLVDGAQILLYGGLGEPQSPGYLSVGEPFDQEPQDLPLASGKYAQIRRALFVPPVHQELPGQHDLSTYGHRDGPEELILRHTGVDEPTGARPERRSRETEVGSRDENQDGYI